MDDPAAPALPPQTATVELDAATQARMVQALRSRLAAGLGTAVALIETHISAVLVGGGRAWKIKKALRTAFLDQSTLALRRHACAEELRLNRRLAPDLYRGVVAITGSAEAPLLGGAGPAIDVAVEMLAFAQDGLWDHLAARGALGAAQVDTLAALLVPFHARAAVAAAGGRLGTPAQVRAPLLDTLRELGSLLPPGAGQAALQPLRAWEAAAFERLAPVFARRLAQGRVRECHGDLHLGNVAEIDGRTTVFDGIEFNDDFRWIDVASEIAFMAMDLQAHGLPALAHRFVDAWLAASGDHDGMRVFDYYLVQRALVRAEVALLRAAQQGGAAAAAGPAGPDYLALALQASRPPGPALLLMHGFSGSGKSTLAQQLLERTGAVRIRADVERKRLAGLPALARGGAAPGGGLYGPAATVATYAQLCERAAAVLDGGHIAILDATFLRRDQRAQAAQLARAHGVRCVVLDVDAAPEVLRQRLRDRAVAGTDPSEADEAVLEAQLRSAEPLRADEACAVFRCRPAAGAGGGAAVDWAPLLAMLEARA